jgi:hypothetical protein
VLSGDFDDIAADIVSQLRACHSYERLKHFSRYQHLILVFAAYIKHDLPCRRTAVFHRDHRPFRLELKFALHWHPSRDWLVALHRYVGVATFVVAATLHIQHGSQRVPLATHNRTGLASQKNGLVAAQEAGGKLGSGGVS